MPGVLLWRGNSALFSDSRKALHLPGRKSWRYPLEDYHRAKRRAIRHEDRERLTEGSENEHQSIEGYGKL